MTRYTIDFASETQIGSRVVNARTPAGAMRAFTKHWDSDGPDPWTFIITVRRESPGKPLTGFLMRMLSLSSIGAPR